MSISLNPTACRSECGEKKKKKKNPHWQERYLSTYLFVLCDRLVLHPAGQLVRVKDSSVFSRVNVRQLEEKNTFVN